MYSSYTVGSHTNQAYSSRTDSLIFATDLPVFGDTGSQCVAVRLLADTLPEQDAIGSSGADGFPKTFPSVPNKFRVSRCGQESRLSLPRRRGTIKG